MNYLRAREINTLPFLVFDLIAENEEELQEWLDENNSGDPDPLVIEETLLTDDEDEDYISYEFGICHKKIFNNEIVDRDSQDITDAQTDNLKAIQVKNTNDVSEELAVSTFAYDSKLFPLTPGAISAYNVIANASVGDITLRATDGNYILTDANRSAFLAEYSDAVLEIYLDEITE